MSLAGGTLFTSGLTQGSLLLNRAIGLGWREAVTPGVLCQLEASYASRGVRNFAVEVALPTPFGDVSGLLRESAYVRLGRSAVMYRTVDGEPAGDHRDGLEVRMVRPDEAPLFARLCCTIFRLPGPFAAPLEASVRRGESRHWFALEDGEAIGTAITTPVCHGHDWIGWVGTQASHRGRGSMKAMTSAQLSDCARRGTRSVSLEVNVAGSDESAASQKNYLGFGWQVTHERVVYVRRLRS
jgi:hypothetical protein